MVVSDVIDSKVTVTLLSMKVTLLSMISLRALSLCYLLQYKSTLNAVKYLMVTLTFNMGLVSLLYSPDHFLPEGARRLSTRLVIF